VSCPHQKTEPFALDLLLTDDQRRPLDEIDDLVEKIRRAEFEEKGSRA